jgi:hypothetical protein
LAESHLDALDRARALQRQINAVAGPPEEGLAASGLSVLPFSLVRGTRGYIERIVHQANGSYANGWYDACAVMLRRLLETLIIECFEHQRISAKIKNPSGDFVHLGELVSRTLTEPAWNLGRNARRALPKLKDVGDKSAHSRRFTAHRADIEGLAADVRLVVQELLYLAGLK